MDTDLVDTEDLSTFVAITGADAEVARSFLSLADGSLDTAVAMFMEHGAGLVSSATRSTPGSTTNATTTHFNSNNASDEVRAAIAPKHDTLVGGGGNEYYANYSHFDDAAAENNDDDVLAASFQSQFTGGVRGRAFGGGGVHASSSSSTRGLGRGAFSDSLDASTGDSKANRLAKLFATPFEIMFDGSFEHAREFGRETLKWILVTVSDRSEFPCEAQKRDLWNNKDVREVVQAHFVFLFHSSDSDEGQSHMNFYKVQGLPYIAIIDPRTGESMKTWYNSPSKTEFIQALTTFLDTYSLENFRAAPKRKATGSVSVGELTEEEQLNLAIAASLGGASSSSKKSGVVVLDDSDNDDDDVDIPDASAEDETTQDRELDAWASISTKIPAEPPATPADAVTRVQFKLPDGSRVVRRFLKTDTVKVLFGFIKSQLAEKDAFDKFELLNFRDALYEKVDQTLMEAKVLNSSITVELKE
ncbi:UNVERIFIED_CONTAM: hypothetical protein HDU68_002011 [Siphonaria sp. JEL0065]|nr:hypothetical protein HDU68_002011 [Siphonaria sp. JEL0065]